MRVKFNSAGHRYLHATKAFKAGNVIASFEAAVGYDRQEGRRI